MIFQLFSVAVLGCYMALIAGISYGWFRLKSFQRLTTASGVKVSLIIAVRNEAANIKNLLSSLFHQDYPEHLLEIIIVDDHSTDHTSQMLNEIYVNQKGVKNLTFLTLSKENGIGKKAALDFGIQMSTGELIVITDADCTAKNNWITTLALFYTQKKPQMILGPVSINHNKSFFSKLQALEFISLISSAAGSCNAGFPLLANGANMAFTRQAYIDCGGFTGNMHYPSGDDMFLMMGIKRKFGTKAIRFLKSAHANVCTPATSELSSFIQQRKRWVSKSRGYSDPLLIAASILVFMANTCLVVSAVSACFVPGFYKFFLLLYFVKMIVDLPLMVSYSRFQQNTALLWPFPWMEFLNAVYTLYIGIAGNFGKYEWKGRMVLTRTQSIKDPRA